jgi:hypothetical protein
MVWDPLGPWQNERRWVWLTLAVWLLVLRAPGFVENLRAPESDEFIPDFFQEYASARNWLENLPIYSPHEVTIPRYLGKAMDHDRSPVIVNAHPPTAVLLALPFASLDFQRAFLAWNIGSLLAFAASLWIVKRQLNIPLTRWSVGPLVTLLLLCYPLWDQCRLGQLTLILVLLLTAAWASERSGRPYLAGVLIGATAAIKLFPGFLLIYYAMRGRWRVVGAGLSSLVVLTGCSILILGIGTYESYISQVLPEIGWFRVGWNNASIWGFWSRLFDPVPDHARLRSRAEPIYYSPGLAFSLSLISVVAALGLLVRSIRLDVKREKEDLTFSLAIVAMLLVSPVAWEHYFLLLLVPLAVVWISLPPTRFARTAFLIIVALLWLGPPLVWAAFDLGGHVATPVHSLGVLSYQFYALLGLFALILSTMKGTGPTPIRDDSSSNAFALGAAVMALMWIHVYYTIWRYYGLFYYLGGDYAIYLSIAKATLARGTEAMYDLDLFAPFARELMACYGPKAPGLNLGPGPYPAVYILPFIALTRVSAPVGFLVWTLMSLGLAVAVARGMAMRYEGSNRGLIAASLCFFPIGFALLFGQLTMLFLYGLYRAYLSLEEGHEFRAGVWSGALYLKPQYAVFLVLVFLYKRRWRALGGLALAGMAVFLSSLAIVGPEGLIAQYETLREMSGFRDVAPIIGPKLMINWRGLLASFLPRDVPDSVGASLTTILSMATTCTLFIVWRGEWNPRGERFPVQFLATVLVMMLASYHNHIHSASLLLIPGMAFAARVNRPPSLLYLNLLSLFAPLTLFYVTASTLRVAWLLCGIMILMLYVIVIEEIKGSGNEIVLESQLRRQTLAMQSLESPADI